jgi:hypothetical protein
MAIMLSVVIILTPSYKIGTWNNFDYAELSQFGQYSERYSAGYCYAECCYCAEAFYTIAKSFIEPDHDPLDPTHLPSMLMQNNKK